ncbi:hypothetical protein B0A52_04081 [Exophiala mesophila]|uniref:Senescence domain-containing protein n=1 Tax=Exophiala mesophila TaxID=212818 RepID=A0A438NAN0_EXOME|nr:hypothetical protein B0A52_04081 [Exophiala mesophila]
MSAGHSEPQVLFSVNNISAYSVQNGEEQPITTSGPQTLSLLMVPTASPWAEPSSADPSSQAPEDDFYLHLHLPPELDLPLPATTQIYHKPPTSYLIPRWDLGPDAGAFIRIQFPSVGTGPGKVSQEDVDTFETILAQCTAFLERVNSPPHGIKQYDPSDYRPGEGYIGSSSSTHQEKPQHGQIVLIDEENGSVIGELQDNYNVVESPAIKPGSKTPVQIQLPQEGQGNAIRVDNVSEHFLEMANHPAYAKSTIVQSSATASRLIVTGSGYIANAMTTGANSFQKKTEPNPKPMTFSPATHDRIRQLHSFTAGAVGISSKTVGQLSRYAQNFGATLARKGDKTKKEPGKDYKPGILNKSLIAFSTIADGIDHAGRQLLASSSSAATNVVGHRYGSEAGSVVQGLAGGVKNVGLVYIDATGVSRRAVLKSVAKGMVVGRMPNGQQLVVGEGDRGLVPGSDTAVTASTGGKRNDYYSGASEYGGSRPGNGMESYGNAITGPPAYSPGIGESLYGQAAPREKR